MNLSQLPVSAEIADAHPIEMTELQKHTHVAPNRVIDRTAKLPKELMNWLASSGAHPLPEESVPGTSPEQRKQLAALGAVVQALLANRLDARLIDERLVRWGPEGPQPPDDVVYALRSLITDRGDVGLAHLYTSIVAGRNRRRLGTFFTPPLEVAWMIEHWCETQPTPSAVVDIGAGVGIFTVAAARRWRGAQVWAVDINRVTLGLLATLVVAQYPVVNIYSQEPGIRLVLHDYVEWAHGAWGRLPQGRLVIGNPPYTRLQLLPQDDRIRLANAAGGLCGGRASMSALMTAVSIGLLSPADGLCLLLPAQWLESTYAVELRNAIWNLRHRRVEMRLFDATLFDDALVDAVALLVGTERREHQPLIIVSREGVRVEVNRHQTCPPRWRALFGDMPTTVPHVQDDPIPPVRLRELAIVRRGVATGANRFFTISEAARRQWQIPDSVLAPLVRRLREFPTVVDTITLASLDDRVPRWLLVADARDRARSVRLARYLEYGKEIGADTSLLCRRRDDWFDLAADNFVPDVIVGPMTRSEFRIVDNVAKAAITNNLYGIRWRDHVPQSVRTAVLTWLRGRDGQHALVAAARRQADGLRKLEPAALRDMFIPNFDGGARPEELNLIWGDTKGDGPA